MVDVRAPETEAKVWDRLRNGGGSGGTTEWIEGGAGREKDDIR